MLEETVIETHEEWALRKRREKMHVTRFQAKAALMQAGLLDQVEQEMSVATDPLEKLAWQEAGFDRLSPMVEQFGAALGMTDEQLDELFETAKHISA